MNANAVECGVKISEKESGSEHRLVFPTPIEKDDWIAKMKDVKIEFRSGTSYPSAHRLNDQL